jgi:hypothetical protein
MGYIAPIYTDNVTVLASSALARASNPATVRTTWDLSAVYGGWLWTFIGRTGVTAPANSIDVIIRRMVGGAPVPMIARRRSNTGTPVTTTLSASSAVGDTTLAFTSGTGFAYDDIIILEPGAANEEYARIERVSTNTIYLDSPLKLTHASAINVYNKCYIFEDFLMGGAIYEIIFDYGASATGNDMKVKALGQIYVKDNPNA